MGREPDYRAAVRGGAHSAADRQSPGPRFVLPRAPLRTRDLTTAQRGRREPEIPSAVFRYLRIRLGLALRRNAVPQASLSIPPILALLARCAILRARVAPRLGRGSFRNRRGRGRVTRRNPPASARRRGTGGRCASDAAGIPRAPVQNTPFVRPVATMAPFFAREPSTAGPTARRRSDSETCFRSSPAAWRSWARNCAGWPPRSSS